MNLDYNLTIKILPAWWGDALYIRFLGNDDKYHNIFIDGGPIGTYQRVLRREVMQLLEAGERIDLLVISHIDNDHIGGALKFIDEFGERDIVDEYWFNHSDVEIPSSSPNGEIGFTQGNKVRQYLAQFGRLPNEAIVADVKTREIAGGAKITILSPTSDDMSTFAKKWDPKKIEEQQRADFVETGAGNSDHGESIKELGFFRDSREKGIRNEDVHKADTLPYQDKAVEINVQHQGFHSIYALGS